MSDTSQKALLFAQAQELERLKDLKDLKAATRDITPFAQFDAEKEILTIYVPKTPDYLAIRSDPFHVFKVWPRGIACHTFNAITPLLDATFSCQIDGNQSCKIWRLRALSHWDGAQVYINPIIFKRDASSTSRLEFVYAGKTHELPFYAVWTKDVEERFCDELDKAWRAFGAEI